MAFIMWKLTRRNFGKGCCFLGLRMFHQHGVLPVCHRKLCTLADSISESLLVKQTEDKPLVRNQSSNDFSCDVLLSTINNNNFTVGSALTLLNTLADLTEQGRIEPSFYIEDKRFIFLCEQLKNQLHRMNNVLIVTALRNLLEMRLDPENKTVQYFENEVLWRIRKMSFKTLSICLHFHSRYRETEMQENVCTELVKAIQARWVEITDADDVIKNLEKASIFDEQFLSRIEERALLVTDKMTLEELHKLCITLANIKRRPLPLLRSISYHITKSTAKLNPKQTTNMLHSLIALNFNDPGILQKLSSDILPDVPTLKGNIIFSLLTTVGQLRWRNPALLDACCEWILINSDSCRTQELVSCILALAALNYKPEKEDNMFAAILPKLNRKLVNADAVWLDVVLSLCVLGRGTPKHTTSVLDSSFYSKFCGSSVSPDVDILCKLKVLTINAVAIIEMSSANVLQKLGNAFKDLKMPQSSVIQKCQESVIADLSYFLPPGKFMATNLNTSLGLLIDAEFIIDKNGKPVPMLQYGIKAGIGPELKSLPPGCNRVAMLILHFKDFTLNTSSLTGKNALAVRLLSKIGYKVVQIPYADFQEHSTVVKRVQYLKKMINEALQDNESKKKS